jgi:hypothetical protein
MGATKQGWIKRKANGNGIPWNKGRNDLPKHTIEHKRKIGLKFIGNKYRLGTKHSEETKKKISESHKGEKAYQWKGGLSDENKLARKSPEYKTWRNAVYRRDKWICQDCGVKCLQGNIVAHHLISFADRKDLRYEVSNGQVLCRPCHARVHSEERNLARSIARAKVCSQITVA